MKRTGSHLLPVALQEAHMAESKWTEEKIARLEREGRGKGSGAEYLPWIFVSDFSSQGKSRRKFSSKSGRHHHLLSDGEHNLFLLLEFSNDVVDIREQFPLERDETRSIAARLNIKHPVYPGTRVTEVMTTDFLVKFNRDGNESLEAFSSKTADDLENPRTLEKLEIERSYYEDLGIPYRLVLDTSLPTNKVKNIYWFRGAVLDDHGLAEYPEEFVELGRRMLHEFSRAPAKGTLAQFCANFDARVGVQVGTGLLIARALLWQGELQTDLNQPDLAGTPAVMFSAPRKPQLRVVGG